jgi:diguanylate cyclase (GGDEF)-like protein
MNKANEVSQELQKLKEGYRRRLPEEMASISEDWHQLISNGWREDIARRVHGACHHLAGTGKTFGFPEITTHARAVETSLNSIFDEGEAPADLDSLDSLIKRLLNENPGFSLEQPGIPSSSDVAELAGGNANAMQQHDRPEARQPPESSAPHLREKRVEPLSTLPIYIVEDDRIMADHIVMELALQGYDARAVYDLADLDKQIRESSQPPGALIMDVIFPGAVTGGIDIINRFREDEILKAPVIFISASDSFSTRLEIVRAGGDAFFVKPFDTHQLIEKLESIIGETNPDPLRVLIVDDDPMLADLVCLLLESAGLNARSINNPLMVIEEVLDFHPDLVILDLHMPEVNGMEVAQVLRQHESCTELPLLFLSAETDASIRAEALNIGVDDFLIKPVNREYLVSAVANRAQRARALGTKIYRDSLTQLLVHDEIKNQLADQLNAAQRRSRELCYVILDLDHFKQINDTYGHLSGDHVIKSIASLLRRSFRRSDVLGRYGGEEFVVIMQDTQLADAVIVLDKVRQEFSQIRHRSESDGRLFTTTFSAGISSFPMFKSADELQVNADRALYEAKDSGRNRVMIANPRDDDATADQGVGSEN